MKIFRRFFNRLMDALRGRPRDQAQENEAPEAPEAPEIPEPIVGQDLLGRDPRLAFLLDFATYANQLGDRTNGAIGWTSASLAEVRDFNRAGRERNILNRAFRMFLTRVTRFAPRAGPPRRRGFPEEYRGDSTRARRPRQ